MSGEWLCKCVLIWVIFLVCAIYSLKNVETVIVTNSGVVPRAHDIRIRKELPDKNARHCHWFESRLSHPVFEVFFLFSAT